MRAASSFLLAIVCGVLAPGCTHLVAPKRQTVQVSVDSICDPAVAIQAQHLLCQAQRQMDHGRLDKAENTLLKAVSLDPDLGPAHNNLGLIYFGRRELYEAAHAFSEAIVLMPGSGLPHNNLGITLEEAGRLNEAIAHYETAHSMEPEIAEFLGNLARARLAQDDFSDDVVYLLEELLLLETRPEWIDWARDELNLMIPKYRYAAQLNNAPESTNSGKDDAETNGRFDRPHLSPPENLPAPAGQAE